MGQKVRPNLQDSLLLRRLSCDSNEGKKSLSEGLDTGSAYLRKLSKASSRVTDTSSLLTL